MQLLDSFCVPAPPPGADQACGEHYLYLVHEWLDGSMGDLFKMRQGRFARSEIIQLVCQAITGMKD